MSAIGRLNTSKPIEGAMREIREWLSKINVNGLSLNTNYDARLNVAVLRFKYKDKDYEFRSTKQTNCRLNMWGIARVMEYKVRAQLMGIEDFETSMRSYLAIEDKSNSSVNILQPTQNEKNYVILGLNSLASNEEINHRWKSLCKTYHPDMANSEEAKKMMSDKLIEINVAYTQIKKERQIT